MTATTPPPDASAFLDPAAPSLASLLAALAALALPPRRVADLGSAVRSLCRVLGKTPAEVPADPGVLGRALRRALPATAGISPARWANIKSLVLQALRLTGCRVLPGRALHPLTPAWAALDALLPTRYDRAGLSRLMHYCAGQGTQPEAVDQAVFDRFGAAILNDSFIRNQRVAHQTAARLWNRAVDNIPGWPQARIAQPRYRRPYVLPLATFPASYQGEVEAWLGRLAGEGPLEEGPLRPLRPRSLEQRRFYLRQAASALVHSGRDPASIAGLCDLVTVEAMQAILRFFLARSGNRPTSQIHGLATHLKAIARHHVGASPAVLEQLGRMVRRVAPPQTGLALKNRLALKQFEDPDLLRRLVRLPAEIYATLPPAGTPLPPRAALRYQWALAVQLLLAAPMRLGNLARLELDRHLLRVGTGKRLHYQLLIPGAEVKNGQPIELPLPAAASALLELYRTRVRPVLAAPGTVWLFPGKHGNKALVTLGGQISRLLARELGVRLTPHQFRHLIGFIYLREHPHGIEVVRALLGHRSIATTLSHYAGLEGAAAARQYDATLRLIAERPGPGPAGKPRKRARRRRQTLVAAE
jgi:integrase